MSEQRRGSWQPVGHMLGVEGVQGLGPRDHLCVPGATQGCIAGWRTRKELGRQQPWEGSASVAHQVCILGQVASPFRETQFLQGQSFVESEADTIWELPLSRRIQKYDYKIAGLWKGPRQLSLSFISFAVNRFWLPHQQNRRVNNSN